MSIYQAQVVMMPDMASLEEKETPNKYWYLKTVCMLYVFPLHGACAQDVVGGSELPRALLTFLHLPTGDLAVTTTYSTTNGSNYGSAE